MGAARDAMTEHLFHATYGSPWLQALVGLDPKANVEERKVERQADREQAQAKRRDELETKFNEGGTVEAALRAIAYVRRGEGQADERSFAAVKQLHEAQPPGRPRSLAQLKSALRDQVLLLRLDEKRAVAAIPKMLPREPDERSRTLRAVQRVVSAQGELSAEGRRRMARVEKLFETKAAAAKKKEDADVRA
jgi:hypothetical protein